MNELRVPKRILVVSLLSLLVFTAFSAPSVSAQDAIDFTLEDISGRSYRLSDYLGEKTVLINFWATWCQPCVKELQHLQKTQEKYGNDLLILAVSVDGPGTRSQVPAFVERYNLTFPVLLDTDSNVLIHYDPRAILPYSVLINRTGEIEYIQKGYSPGDEVVLDEMIARALQAERLDRVSRISYHLNEAFVFRSFSDQGYVDNYRDGRSSEVLNQTDILVTAYEYMIGLRIDSSLDYSPLDDRHILANRFVEINRNGVNLRVGDFYHVIGKGLSLSVAKLFEQEGLEHTLESSIRGSRISLNRNRYSIELFGGTIGGTDSENSDYLKGGTAGYKFGNSVGLHFTYLDADIVTGLSTEWDDYSIQTLGLDIPYFAGIARASGEISLLQHKIRSTDERVRGHAVYLESGLDLGEVSIQVEYKDYDHFDFKYSRPPSLESEDLDIIATQFNTEVIDISGTAGRIDYRPGQGPALIYGKLSFFNDTPDDHPLWGAYTREISHYLTGFEMYFGDVGYVNMLAGYREEDASSPLLFFSDNNTWHYQINAFYSFSPRLSIEADWKSKRYESDIYNSYEDRAFLALHSVSRGIVTLFYERSNDPELRLATNKTEWWAGQIEVKLSSSNSISATWGATKGGVKCSGGVCQAFPPFEGLRLEMIYRF